MNVFNKTLDTVVFSLRPHNGLQAGAADPNNNLVVEASEHSKIFVDLRCKMKLIFLKVIFVYGTI